MARSQLLQLNELRGGVVLGIGADLGVGRDASDAQEVLDRAGAIAGLLLRLALFVDGGGEALGEIGAQLRVVCR